MNESIKVKVAALAAALFLGGIAFAGVSSRTEGEKTAAEASNLKPRVIHKRKVKTVRVPAASVVSAAPPASSVVPVSAPASTPAPVSSQTSPGGSGRGGDYEGEREKGEHEGGGEDD